MHAEVKGYLLHVTKRENQDLKGTQMTRKIAIFSIALVLAACSKPTIDTSSDEAMKVSTARVRESLPQSKQTEFDQALQVLAFSNLDFGSLMKDGMAGTETSLNAMKSTLSGKNADQILAEAAKIIAERKEMERAQALAEIHELQGKKAGMEKAKLELAKFQVTRSRFSKQHREYMGDQPIIELMVRNGTSQAVSRAYFVGTIASPNRSVPWMKDDFNYQISGGLEPGEEAKWSLAPNMFSDWGKVNAPADAVFTVEVVKLDGADGKTLYSADDFTEHDAERLAKLTDEFGSGK